MLLFFWGGGAGGGAGEETPWEEGCTTWEDVKEGEHVVTRSRRPEKLKLSHQTKFRKSM